MISVCTAHSLLKASANSRRTDNLLWSISALHIHLFLKEGQNQVSLRGIFLTVTAIRLSGIAALLGFHLYVNFHGNSSESLLKK